MTILCTKDVAAYLAGVLQLDELTLQQDPLFHPFLQKKRKGGNFLNHQIHFRILIIQKNIDSKFMRNRSQLAKASSGCYCQL